MEAKRLGECPCGRSSFILASSFHDPLLTDTAVCQSLALAAAVGLIDYATENDISSSPPPTRHL